MWKRYHCFSLANSSLYFVGYLFYSLFYFYLSFNPYYFTYFSFADRDALFQKLRLNYDSPSNEGL